MQWTDEQLQRHSRQIILKEIGIEGVEAFARAKVLVVGLGGLGSPIALYLAAAGIGTLGLADFDVVSLSNMQRQILYGEKDLGQPKVSQAIQRLQSLNSQTRYISHSALKRENILEILADYDYIVEGSDNFSTKYLVNDACVLLRKPFTLGGILRFEGQAMSYHPQQRGCYRCLFPQPPAPQSIPTCAEAGILGPVAGAVGSMQALEVLKGIAQCGKPLWHRFALFDFLHFEPRILSFEPNPHCPACGQNPATELLPEISSTCLT